MEKIQLERDNETALEFDGELIETTNSRVDHDQARWTELAVYRTSRNKWVLQIMGKSAIAGEVTRSKVIVCETDKELAEAAFYKKDRDGGRKLSYPARKLMQALFNTYKSPEFNLVTKI